MRTARTARLASWATLFGPSGRAFRTQGEAQLLHLLDPEAARVRPGTWVTLWPLGPGISYARGSPAATSSRSGSDRLKSQADLRAASVDIPFQVVLACRSVRRYIEIARNRPVAGGCVQAGFERRRQTQRNRRVAGGSADFVILQAISSSSIGPLELSNTRRSFGLGFAMRTWMPPLEVPASTDPPTRSSRIPPFEVCTTASPQCCRLQRCRWRCQGIQPPCKLTQPYAAVRGLQMHAALDILYPDLPIRAGDALQLHLPRHADGVPRADIMAAGG